MTFTTAAFGRSSSWLFEASPYRAAPKGLPSSFAQLRITVWTGDARDTRMIEDMKLAGLSPGTRATYVDAVRKLAAHYRRSPDQLSEEEVRAYILNLRERGAARGTFKANYYGIQYLYRYTVDRDWALFAKKNIRLPKQKRLRRSS